MAPKSHSEIFVEAGELLFGPEWQSPMARAVDINLRTVQRLAAAVRDGREYPVNPAVLERVREVLRRTADDCMEMREEIAEALR